MSLSNKTMMKFCFWIGLLYLLLPPYVSTNDSSCDERDSCTNGSSMVSPSIYNDELFLRSRNCFCDDLCEEYGDCCHRRRSSHQSKYQCIDYLSPIFTHQTLSFTPLSVWMKTECLPIYKNSLVEHHCRNSANVPFYENSFLFIPVTNRKSHVTYRNYFCAYCNNDIHDGIVFWEFRLFCSKDGNHQKSITLTEEDELKYYTSNSTKQCLKTIMYPHLVGTMNPAVFLRPCKITFSRPCPSSTPIDLARNCSRAALAYRYNRYTNHVYENQYCAQCHHQNSSEITCFDPLLRSAIPILAHLRVQPLSILFNPKILQNVTHHLLQSGNMTCSKRNKMDALFFEKCSTKMGLNDLKCTYPVTMSGNRTIDFNGTLHFFEQSITLHRDQYMLLTENQILFCADQWMRNLSRFPFYRHVLSLICSSVSFICLVIFIIAFGLSPSLHNLPGQCLLQLTLSILCGQLTFMLTSEFHQKSFTCFLSALLIHYFYLSSFFWLLIITVQIHSTFTRQTVPRDRTHSTKYRLCMFSVLVWSISGIVVISACLIQWLSPQSKFSPNYGLIFCSLSNPTAMAVFFLVPIGLVLLIVLVLFIKTVFVIHHSHQTAKFASVSSTSTSSSLSNPHLIFVYIRLASLMGLQWILLILALLLQRTWSWLIFEIINSLPGVFICLGFLFSPRLWQNIKDKISMKVFTRRVSSRSHLMTTTTTLINSTFLTHEKKRTFRS